MNSFIKNIWVAFFIITQLYATDVALKLDVQSAETQQDKQGNTVFTVFVNEPFQAEVTILEHGIDTVQFDNKEHFSIANVGRATQFSSVNGVTNSSKVYTYHVTVDKEGDFILGPVKGFYQGGTKESNVVRLHVAKHAEGQQKKQSVPQQTSSQGDDTEVFCKFVCDKKNIVVSEPVFVTLNVYCRGGVVQLSLAEKPSFDGFLVKEIPQDKNRQETINGKTFNVIEKKFLLFPMQAGTKTIKPVHIVYDRQIARKRTHRSVFDMFESDFFAPQVERRQVASNSLNITVNQLPAFKDIVHGVGTFDRFDAHIDKKEAMLNEPIVLQLTIHGKGNFDQIAFPKLNLPENCKFYESKANVNEDLSQGYTGGSKTFEFVIQVNQAGELEIPAQCFTFYDVQKKTYQTIMSAPQIVNIKPVDEQVVNTPEIKRQSPEQEEPVQDQQKNIDKPLQDVHFIHEDWNNEKQTGAMPLWLMIVLLLILSLGIVLGFYGITNTKKISIVNRLFKQTDSRKILHIKKEIELALEASHVNELHRLFITLLCARFGVAIEEVSDAVIEENFRARDWSDDKISEFLDFMNACASLRFTSGSLNVQNQKELIKRGRYWLLFLIK
jgi:hypothetical protein